MMDGVLIRNASLLDAGRADVLIRGGRIADMGPALQGGSAITDIDARGGLLIPGLHDHHIHLFAQAARAATVDLEVARSWPDVLRRLAARSAMQAATDWIRAIGYDERVAGLEIRPLLDQAFPVTPVRIQDRTGALWILNGAALAIVGVTDAPPGLERDAAGAPTGLVWREDLWLRARAPSPVPDLAALSRTLSAFGVTGVTDASISTTQASAALLAQARRQGRLAQRLTLMSGDALSADPEGAYAIGPRKIVLDERHLPEPEDVAGLIREARAWGRNVAFHCVADSELAIALAALDMAGAVSGDRIEHAGVTPASAVAEVRRLGVCVVTQPGFIALKGDRYLEQCPQAEHDDLYRCGSFLACGVPVAGSSDAPFGPLDPWTAMRSAVSRAAPSGRPVAPLESISSRAALELYLRSPDLPGDVRQIRRGAVADVCLLTGSLEAMLAGDGAVARVWIGGADAYSEAQGVLVGRG